LLRKVMLQYPETVRIVLSGFFDAKVTDRLLQTAHQYLCKPCSPTELKEAISRALFLRDLLANERLKQFVSQIQSLPCVPALYTELMMELQRSAPSLDEIINTISRDMSLSTRMLQLANSPVFGLTQRVTDIEQAVTELGIEPVKTLVLSLQTFSVFERLKKDERSLKPLWHHSWAVGRLAQRIGEAENFERYGIDQSLAAGLLHDVGKLVFLTGVPQQFAQAIDLQRENKVALWRAEQETFGCTHAEVGAYLLARWGLPIPVVETVALHHSPSASSTRSLSVITAVHAADALEREAEASLQIAPIAELDAEYLAQLGLTARLEAWRELRSHLLAETIVVK
jgi:putative nucleotidyltransferase with HDIG domain